MTGASLKGLSEDGTHLLVVTDDGHDVRLAITDELRALVRHARVVRREEDTRVSTMSPREIQQRIRAGLNAAELAHLTGEPVEALAKFEAPVLAERAYIVSLARQTPIGRSSSSPQLADLVDDRLAARGVDPAAAAWDAWREIDEPWRVAVDYPVAGRITRAVWTYDHQARTLTAEDAESSWLSETELLEAPIPRRHLAAVRPTRPEVPQHSTGAPSGQSGDFLEPDLDADARDAHLDMGHGAHDVAEADEPDPDEIDERAAMLEALGARRGTRETIEVETDDDDERFEGFGPASAARRRHEAAQLAAPAGEAPASRSRKGRASVPSWDEIVFGTKND